MNQKISYYTIPGLKQVHKSIKFDVINSEIITSIVCSHYETTMEKLKRPSRFADIVLARNTLSYFLFKYSTLNKSQIARMLNKDHTTIIHGLQAFNDRMETEEPVREHIEAIRSKLFVR